MTEDYKPPLGDRFSQLYIDRGEPQKDSSRLRNRIAAYVENNLYVISTEIRQIFNERLGTNFYAQNVYDVSKVIRELELRDFLDSVTLVYKTAEGTYLRSSNISSAERAARWLRFCQGSFIEENSFYIIDSDAICRPFIDNEFRRNIQSTLAGLSHPRLKAVREEASAAFEKLQATQPDPKAAIRAVFEAFENYIKQIVTTYDVKALANAIKDHMLPTIKARYGSDRIASEAADKYVDSVCDWIAGAHKYRHGQGVEEPLEPPFDLAVAYVSAGMSHLRWLVQNTADKLPDA